jgi:hypothetical protein
MIMRLTVWWLSKAGHMKFLLATTSISIDQNLHLHGIFEQGHLHIALFAHFLHGPCTGAEFGM